MIKSTLILLGFLFTVLSANAGWESRILSFDGKAREYMIYVPEGYSEEQPATLIVALHGLGGSMEDIAYTGISTIADTANIIIAAPQALDFESPAGTIAAAWSNGIAVELPGFGTVTVNGDVDDVGFINAMMDTIHEHYSIKEHRNYICGMSMGGFMTQRLACESSSRFDAAASVAGTYALALPECEPVRKLPVAHFHGTDDSVVTYNGYTPFPILGYVAVGLGVETLIDKWVGINNCLLAPETINVPDANSDGLSMDHFLYANAAGRSMVELFRINGGIHTWYTSASTGNEFDYAGEIWKFFNKQYAVATSLHDSIGVPHAEIFPNPATDKLFISNGNLFSEFIVCDISGKPVVEQKGSVGVIELSPLQPGIYFLKAITKEGVYSMAKFIKQ